MSIASMRFDLPDPFGPINTFKGNSSISAVVGPYERKFLRRIDLRSRFIAFSS